MVGIGGWHLGLTFLSFLSASLQRRAVVYGEEVPGGQGCPRPQLLGSPVFPQLLCFVLLLNDFPESNTTSAATLHDLLCLWVTWCTPWQCQLLPCPSCMWQMSKLLN